MSLLKALKRINARLRLDEPLKNHSTFRIGPKVSFWVEPRDIFSLKETLLLARRYNLPFFVIGKGSNILFSGQKIRAIAVNFCGGVFSYINRQDREVFLGAGTSVSEFLAFCVDSGLSGAEFLAGIPASIGGVVWNNAAALNEGKKAQVSDMVQALSLMDYEGAVFNLDKSRLKASYKTCGLKDCIILDARFKLNSVKTEQVRKKIRANIIRRHKSQPLSMPSLGCIFKNPSELVSEGLTAGELIDRAGLKGRRIGEAEVSELHANYIINLGRAKSSDVLKLMKIIQDTVRKKYDIMLQPEIQIIKNR